MPRQKRQHLTQRKDGRYCCKYKGIQFMGPTEDEALQARDEYKRQEATGLHIIKNQTVQQYAEKWLPLHKGNVSPKCYRDYQKQLEALYPVIGNKHMNSVTVDDAASIWKHYAGYSASTIKRAKMLFTALFDAAIENDLCWKNPFKSRFAQPPKAPSGSHRALTDDEISAILNTPHRMQLAALIMLYAGLRRGEVLALTSADITDTEIIISKAVRFVGNRPVITAPKTAAGVRRVPVLKVLQPFLSNATERILSAKDGGLMTDTAFRRCWDSFLLHLSRTAGHPIKIRPHDLRHTYCTMLRDAGVDMKQAMLWMGHSDEKMILHVYDHVTDRRTLNSVNQVEKMLLRMQNGMQNSSKDAKTPSTQALSKNQCQTPTLKAMRSNRTGRTKENAEKH